MFVDSTIDSIVSQLLKFVFFADNINTIYSSNTIDDVDVIIETELKKLHTWFQINKLSLDMAKSNFIMFRIRNVQYIPDIIISDHHLDRVSSTTFLCVNVDETLSWSAQYNICIISGIITS